MKVEISNGEIIDKLIILQIKLERVKDKTKLVNIKKEYNELVRAASSIISLSDSLVKALYDVNLDIWNMQERIHEFERRNELGEGFISILREVHLKNNERFELKKKINLRTSSNLIEEKSYKEY